MSAAPTSPAGSACTSSFVIAVIELVNGLSSASILFGDMSEIPGPGIGGAIIKLHLATHPVLALAALIFCGAIQAPVQIVAFPSMGAWANRAGGT